MQQVAGLYRQYSGGGPGVKKVRPVLSETIASDSISSPHPSQPASDTLQRRLPLVRPALPAGSPNTTLSSATTGILAPASAVRTLMPTSPPPRLMQMNANGSARLGSRWSSARRK